MADKLKKEDLRAQLASAESELQEYINRVQILREWIAVTRKLCGKKPLVTNQLTPAGVTQIARRRTKTSILASQVAQVLISVGHPLHVNEIVAELSRRGQSPTAENPAATVAVALARRPEQFVKVSPNTFDLVKKDQQGEIQAMG